MSRTKTTDTQFSFRITAELVERFKFAVTADELLQGLDPGELSSSTVMRALMREYCTRIESVSASDVAQHANKVLRKAVRR